MTLGSCLFSVKIFSFREKTDIAIGNFGKEPFIVLSEIAVLDFSLILIELLIVRMRGK